MVNEIVGLINFILESSILSMFYNIRVYAYTFSFSYYMYVHILFLFAKQIIIIGKYFPFKLVKESFLPFSRILIIQDQTEILENTSPNFVRNFEVIMYVKVK